MPNNKSYQYILGLTRNLQILSIVCKGEYRKAIDPQNIINNFRTCCIGTMNVTTITQQRIAPGGIRYIDPSP